MSKTEKATREYLQTLTKDRLIELCLQYKFDAKITERQLKETKDKIDLYEKFVCSRTIEEVIEADWRKREIDQLKQQLEEKDKEIERLNNILNIEIPAILKNTRNMLNERFIWKNIK